jgi:hypothetical protein
LKKILLVCCIIIGTIKVCDAQILLSDNFETSLSNTPTTTTNPLWVQDLTSFPIAGSPTLTPLAGSYSLTTSTSNSPNYIYNQYSTNIGSVNRVWRLLYNAGGITPDNNDPQNGKQSWNFFLAADGSDPSSCYGYYLTHRGSTLYLRVRKSGGTLDIASYTISNNATYTIKVTRRASDGFWTLYVDTGTGEASTSRGTGNNTEATMPSNMYTILYCNDKNTSNAFTFDNYTISSASLTFGCTTAGLANTYLYAGDANKAVYSFQTTTIEDVPLKVITVSNTGNLSNGQISSFSLIKSTNTTYGDADDVDITSQFSAANNGSNFQFNNNNTNGYTLTGTSSSTTAYFFLVVSMSSSFVNTSIASTFSMSSASSSIQYAANHLVSTASYSCTGNTYSFGKNYDWSGNADLIIGFPDLQWSSNKNWVYNATTSVANEAPGQYDRARIGNIAYTVSGRQPMLMGNTTIGDLLIGSLNSPTLDLTLFTLTVSNTFTMNTSATLTLNASGISSGTLSVGNASGSSTMASTSVLTLAGRAILNNSAGTFTLKSDASGSATIAAIPSTASVKGSYAVERFFTGGSSSANRGYRMLSSPVNQTSATFSNANTYSLSFLKNGVFTGGTGGTGSGFSGTSAGPTLYLYKETRTPSNASFTAGKHLGISTVNASTLVLSDGTTVSLPVGNGYLFYFVGPASRTSGSSAITPLDATTTSTGYINQGTFNVNLWYTPTNGAGKLSYTAALTTPGLNMVGNPYPSTINLNTLLSDNANATTGITAIYELDSRTGGSNQNYVAYTASGNSSPMVQGYAVSGGGFLVRAASATSVLTFKESQKSNTQLTGTSLIMSAPNAQVITANGMPMGGALTASQKRLMAALPPATSDAVTGFYMKMEKDNQVYNYCGVYFKKGASEKYEGADAEYLAGPTAPVSMSSLSSDGIKTAVNLLPDYHNGIRVKLNVTANTSGLYHLRLEDVRNIDALYDIYLLDRLKKDSLDIRHYGVYDFNLNTADTATFGANRFELSIRRKPLPEYLLANFTASKANEGVKVNWETQNESNYTGFTLEKMNKATAAYEPIYEKQSDGSSTYAFTDRAPNSGNNTYRLKQNDIDSRISYSEPVTIFYDKNAAKGLISIFPNPTVETLNVSVPVQSASTSYLLRLYNSSGNLILQKSSITSNWSENIGTLKTGAYIVEVIKKDGTSLGKTKFIKN